MPSTRDINSELNGREKWFVEYYAAGDSRTLDNARQSAILSGYSVNTADAWASTWVLDPKTGKNPKPWVWRAIQERRAQVMKQAAMTATEVLEETSKLARHNPRRYLRPTDDGDVYIDFSDMTEADWAAIGAVEVEEYLDGRGEDARTVKRVKVKAWDKKGALDLMSKVLGLQKTVLSNDPENPLPGTVVNAGVQYDLSKLTLDEVEQLMALLEKAKLG